MAADVSADFAMQMHLHYSITDFAERAESVEGGLGRVVGRGRIVMTEARVPTSDRDVRSDVGQGRIVA